MNIESGLRSRAASPSSGVNIFTGGSQAANMEVKSPKLAMPSRTMCAASGLMAGTMYSPKKTSERWASRAATSLPSLPEASAMASSTEMATTGMANAFGQTFGGCDCDAKSGERAGTTGDPDETDGAFLKSVAHQQFGDGGHKQLGILASGNGHEI